MIRYCEKLTVDDLDFLQNDSLKVKITSLLLAYGAAANFLDFWIISNENGPCGAVCRFESSATVSVNDEADFEELSSFLRVIAAEVLCTKEVREKLSLCDYQELFEVEKHFDPIEAKQEQIDIFKLYELLKKGEDGDLSLPDKNSFYVDLSHRMRHKTAAAVLFEDSAAVCGFIGADAGLISGVAVEKSARGKGKGKSVLDAVCRSSGRETVFAHCTKQKLPFYLSCGFKITKELCIGQP